MGVPLVRGLGSGVSHAAAGDRRPRLCQAPDGTDAAWLVPPPQRPDARLRVELQRREPARPRLCDAVPASQRAGPARQGGRRLPPIDLQQAPAELHLVGQPEGPLRQERVRGRFSRPGQHRRLRPQRPAAHRRPPRAGGRHGVDGPLQREHAGARDRACRPRSGLRGHGLQVRGALLLHRRGNEPLRPRRHVGRGGRFLLRHPAASRRQRHAAQSAFAGRTPSAMRNHGDREVAAGADPGRDGLYAGAPAPDPRTGGRRSTRPARGTSAWPSGVCSRSSTRRGSGGF